MRACLCVLCVCVCVNVKGTHRASELIKTVERERGWKRERGHMRAKETYYRGKRDLLQSERGHMRARRGVLLAECFV